MIDLTAQNCIESQFKIKLDQPLFAQNGSPVRSDNGPHEPFTRRAQRMLVTTLMGHVSRHSIGFGQH